MSNPTLIQVKVSQANLRELLSLVRSGAEVILTEDNTPLARLLPVLPLPKKKRVAGLHKGTFQIQDDLDEPLPDEFWLGQS